MSLMKPSACGGPSLSEKAQQQDSDRITPAYHDLYQHLLNRRGGNPKLSSWFHLKNENSKDISTSSFHSR